MLDTHHNCAPRTTDLQSSLTFSSQRRSESSTAINAIASCRASLPQLGGAKQANSHAIANGPERDTWCCWTWRMRCIFDCQVRAMFNAAFCAARSFSSNAAHSHGPQIHITAPFSHNPDCRVRMKHSGTCTTEAHTGVLEQFLCKILNGGGVLEFMTRVDFAPCHDVGADGCVQRANHCIRRIHTLLASGPVSLLGARGTRGTTRKNCDAYSILCQWILTSYRRISMRQERKHIYLVCRAGAQ